MFEPEIIPFSEKNIRKITKASPYSYIAPMNKLYTRIFNSLFHTYPDVPYLRN